MFRTHRAPQCPYCGDIASYGDSRHSWMRYHLDSRIHRVWWWFKRKLKRKRKA